MERIARNMLLLGGGLSVAMARQVEIVEAGKDFAARSGIQASVGR